MTAPVILSGIGVSAPQPIRNHNVGDPGQPVNSPLNPWSALVASVIAVVSAGGSLTFNIEFSNDGVNFNPDAASTGLTSSTNYSLVAFVNFWRLNVTAYTSGSVSASAGMP